MDALYRELAPITEEAWNQLDEEARTRLARELGARRLVDFAGPLGWTHSSTSLGRVGKRIETGETGVTARQRLVLPMAEVRADFTLRRDELDDIARGAADPDLGPLDEAAKRIASVENAAVLMGWDAVGFDGAGAASPHPPIRRGESDRRLAQHVAAAVDVLAGAGVGGPYAMAVDSPIWTEVLGGSDVGGAPLQAHLERILGGDIVWAPGVEGAVVLSRRGGDFLFESGRDLSLGYDSHTADEVALYLVESFTFRVATPEAAVAIR